jgi:hypothetical protein
VILWLQLAAATIVLLAPGAAVARALGQRGTAAALVWSVAVVAGALMLTFAVHGSLTLTLVLVLLAGAVAAVVAWRRKSTAGSGPKGQTPGQTPGAGRPSRPSDAPKGQTPGAIPILLAGLGLGIALWSLEGVVGGDALFHLGRMRKLLDFGSLALRTVDEFKDGGLHPGYAFPLWHAWLALVAKVAGVDPAHVVLHESSLLAPLALLIAYELGVAVFGSASLGVATMLAQAAVIALAPGSGGAYTSLELPGTTARQLLVPAVLVLFFRFVRAPSWPLAVALAAAGMDLAFVHPTYALFVAIPLVGYAVVRALAVGDVRRSLGGLVAFGVPVLAVFGWLEPIVAQTKSVNPGRKGTLQGLHQYASDLVVHSTSSYHLQPGLVSRTGAVAVAALALTPVAALAARRRWSAVVLGGTAIVLVLELAPFVFPRFSDLVSLSQSRRAAGFVPFAIALAGGLAVAARLLRAAVLPVALAAGLALEELYPGDFELHIRERGPAWATWLALFGGLVGIAASTVLARRGLGRYERPGVLAGLAAALFVLPVAVHGFADWNALSKRDPDSLTPGLVAYLRRDVPKGAVVYADLQTSYRISAYAPVYVADAPPSHVADTKANRPGVRLKDLRRFLRTHDLAIPRRYGAGWLVLRGRERVGPGARLVYRDARFRVYRL